MACGGARPIALNGRAEPETRTAAALSSQRLGSARPLSICRRRSSQMTPSCCPEVLVRGAHGVGGAAIPIAFQDFSTGCSTKKFLPRRRARTLGIAAARRFDSDRVRSLGSFGQAEMLVAWPCRVSRSREVDEAGHESCFSERDRYAIIWKGNGPRPFGLFTWDGQVVYNPTIMFIMARLEWTLVQAVAAASLTDGSRPIGTFGRWSRRRWVVLRKATPLCQCYKRTGGAADDPNP
jgi:hypothetical protein